MTSQTTKFNVCNVSNRTIFEGDNLDVMRGINDACIDLIYLDPPFNSNRDYAAPIGSKAAGAAFKDTWDLTDVDEAWHNQIAETDLPLYKIIDASQFSHGNGMKSYLIMMAVRLLEMSMSRSFNLARRLLPQVTHAALLWAFLCKRSNPPYPSQ